MDINFALHLSFIISPYQRGNPSARLLLEALEHLTHFLPRCVLMGEVAAPVPRLFCPRLGTIDPASDLHGRRCHPRCDQMQRHLGSMSYVGGAAWISLQDTLHYLLDPCWGLWVRRKLQSQEEWCVIIRILE